MGVKQISCGYNHDLILKDDGSVWASGRNYFGQLGDGTNVDTENNIFVNSMNDVIFISAGEEFSLFIKDDNSLWSCGLNTCGRLGDGTEDFKYNPVKIMENIRFASAGSCHGLAIGTDNTLWGFGSNCFGQLGDGTNINRYYPIKISDNVKMASAGTVHSLFVTNDNKLMGMGNSDDGQLGRGESFSTNKPIKIEDDVRIASCGYQYSLFIKKNGLFIATGGNNYSKIGRGNSYNDMEPDVLCNRALSYVESNGCHSIAIQNDGTAWFLKNNVFVKMYENTRKASVGDKHVLFERNDGNVYKFKQNYSSMVFDCEKHKVDPIKIEFLKFLSGKYVSTEILDLKAKKEHFDDLDCSVELENLKNIVD